MDNQPAIIRNYCHKTDFESIKQIHESSGIDYKFPDISTPLWVVTKVIEINGKIRVAAGMYIQAETYLWLDKSDWAIPEDKLLAIQILEKEVMEETWLKGVDQAVLWLPPGMGSFGKRLTKDLGFEQDREGWVTYSRPTKK